MRRSLGKVRIWGVLGLLLALVLAVGYGQQPPTMQPLPPQPPLELGLGVIECNGGSIAGIAQGCWKQLTRENEGRSEAMLVSDSSATVRCLGFMTQNWEPNNDDMVGLKCRTEGVAGGQKAVLEKDWYSAEPGPSQCTYLCSSLLLPQCPAGNFFCWQQLTSFGEGSLSTLLKNDPNNQWQGLAFMSQNYDNNPSGFTGPYNDDMVGLKCTITTSGSGKFGKLEKDWYRAEPGPSQCTYLAMYKITFPPGFEVVECPGGSFSGAMCWKQSAIQYGEGTALTPLVNDPNNQYQCLGFMSQNWEDRNDDMVGLKCTIATSGSLKLGRLEKDWYRAESGPSQCTYLCMKKK